MSVCQNVKVGRGTQKSVPDGGRGSGSKMRGACGVPEAVLHLPAGAAPEEVCSWGSLLFIIPQGPKREIAVFALGSRHLCGEGGETIGVRESGVIGFNITLFPIDTANKQTDRQNTDSLIWNKIQSREHANVSAYLMIIDFLSWF